MLSPWDELDPFSRSSARLRVKLDQNVLRAVDHAVPVRVGELPHIDLAERANQQRGERKKASYRSTRHFDDAIRPRTLTKLLHCGPHDH